MKLKNVIILVICIVTASFPLSVVAQEAPPPEDEMIDSELPLEENDDPAEPADSDDTESQDKANHLDKSSEGNQEDQQKEAITHTIEFNFTSRVQFFNWVKTNEGYKALEEPYLEIEYTNECRLSTELSEKKENKKAVCEVTTNRSGSLAANEFFECRLDIDIDDIEADVSTRVMKTLKKVVHRPGDINTDQTEEKVSLALKIHFNDDPQESWYSLCTDFASGTQLNTEGEKENYNLQIIKRITPSLSSIVVEDFDPEADTKIDLSTPLTIIEDIDLANNIQLSGEGTITIETGS